MTRLGGCMWERFLPPGSSARRRTYADGRPRAAADLWRRWGWLTWWALAGLVTLELAGMICSALGRGSGMQAVALLLMSLPLVVLAVAALAVVVLFVLALLARLGRWVARVLSA